MPNAAVETRSVQEDVLLPYLYYSHVTGNDLGSLDGIAIGSGVLGFSMRLGLPALEPDQPMKKP